MRPDDLREWLQVLPFLPFRLWLADGTSYDVHHPEIVVVKRSTADLYFTAHQPRVPLDERFLTIALLHISRLQSLKSVNQSSANGV